MNFLLIICVYKTKDILAKIVGFLCSNPNCRKLTIGSNEKPNETTLIIIASHITSASKGGLIYDDSISSERRRDIENGIWLCNNWPTLIDKDPEKYTNEVLWQWKREASVFKQDQHNVPILEADLTLKCYTYL